MADEAVRLTERELREQLQHAEAIAHVGSWRWELATGTVIWSDELYRIHGLPPQSRPITVELFLSCLHPDDAPDVQREIEAAMHRPGRFAYRERIIRPGGELRTLDTIGEAVADAGGHVTALIGTCRDVSQHVGLALEDVTARRSAQILQAGERKALEMLAEGAPLGAILEVIVTTIEELSPAGTLASILLLDETGGHIRHGAAPRLPEGYSRAIDGSPIGPRAGSCGTAAYRREPVYVTDIATDPLWEDYRDLARRHGLGSCWSVPMLSNEGGRVLGTFALYHREPRVPDASARELLARASHVTGIVLERRALDEQLRALTARIEAIREDERTVIARDIHDQLGQALTALKLDLGWLSRRISDAELHGKLGEMARATDEIIRTVRRISADLRPSILDDIGLQAAIEWQAEEFEQRSGIHCRVRAEIGDLRLERELATTVFRIFQESLTNVARHADAREVDVTLVLDHGQIRLEIVDDGVGIPEVGPRNSTLGILGMGERARRLGGSCTVKRRTPHGTVVTLVMPLQFPSERRGLGG